MHVVFLFVSFYSFFDEGGKLFQYRGFRWVLYTVALGDSIGLKIDLT